MATSTTVSLPLPSSRRRLGWRGERIQRLLTRDQTLGYLFLFPAILVIVGLVAYPRSEEHTSELQSRGHLVCRLLLEKKKTNTHPTTLTSTHMLYASSSHDSLLSLIALSIMSFATYSLIVFALRYTLDPSTLTFCHCI